MIPHIQIDRTHLNEHPLKLIEELLEGVYALDPPPFALFEPDLKAIAEAAEPISHCNDIVIIGHGGSITTFRGLLGSVGRDQTFKRRIHIIDTVDPLHIETIKGVIDPASTHIIAISRSGNTLTVLEALTFFRGLPTTVVTVPEKSTLRSLAARNGWNIVDVPTEIGGRFSGRTASALLPAAAIGLDIGRISQGIGEAYEHMVREQDVLDLCGSQYLCERVGKRILYLPVYSKGLSAFNDLITQLMHETVGKERKGMTVLCFEGPESQHHTNQRVLDGPEDVQALFVSVNRTPGDPVLWMGGEGDELYKEMPLSDIGGHSLSRAMEAEQWGVMRSMQDLKLPFGGMVLRGESEEEMGFYIGLWHYIAYYFALLRRVEPFGQPAVDASKESALSYRLGM
ncbi:MAG: hypothetical protein KAH57_04690 [Thermoplasmata archaeon]|nr:hypothetical protein [Thermoplasmata archaeon]